MRIIGEAMDVDTLNQALKAAQAMSCNSTKSTKLSEIGSKYVELGLEKQGLEILDQAFQLAQVLNDADDRDLTLCDVAYAYGKVGQYDLAIDISRMVVEDEFRAALRILEPLVKEALHLGLTKEVLKLIKAAQDIGFETFVIRSVIEHYVGMRDFDYPHQLVKVIESPDSKISILVDLAKIHFQEENCTEGSDLLHEANAIAEGIEDESSRAFAKDIVNSIYVRFSN